MKMKTIEEKAKRYDEAIEKATIALKDEDRHLKATLERIFPSLKENEDERIRKALIEHFNFSDKNVYYEINGIPHKKVIAWFEKQGEHKKFRDSIQVGDKVTRNEDGVLVNLSQLNRVAKPADKIESFDEYEGLTDFERTLTDICIGWIGQELGWKQYIKDNADVLLKIAIKKFNSIQDAPFEQKPATWGEEDETKIKSIIVFLKSPALCCMEGNKGIIDENIKYLKSLKDRVQPKQEWSEEDDEMLRRCISATFDHGYLKECDLLKFLKGRYTWKPSDEQMDAIKDAIDYLGGNNKTVRKYLMSLYEDLKKLRGA